MDGNTAIAVIVGIVTLWGIGITLGTICDRLSELTRAIGQLPARIDTRSHLAGIERQLREITIQIERN